MDDVLNTIQEMLEEGFSEEEAQFIAADRCFGSIAYNENKINRQMCYSEERYLIPTVRILPLKLKTIECFKHVTRVI